MCMCIIKSAVYYLISMMHEMCLSVCALDTIDERMCRIKSHDLQRTVNTAEQTQSTYLVMFSKIFKAILLIV